MGQCPWSKSRWRLGPNKANILGKSLGGKSHGKQSWLGALSGYSTGGSFCP
jgi:hypothetical protein